MQRACQRHDLVWLDPCADVEAFVFAAGNEPAVRNWVEQGWPFVVARQPAQADDRRLFLGFTLPPPATRRRVALSAPVEQIVRRSGPLRLDEAVPHLPVCHDTPPLLLSLSDAAGALPCLYGSASWQVLTGRSYLTATSDLDVLFICDETTDILTLIHGLTGFLDLTPRLDGEIFAPTGWAAAWRELCVAVNGGKTARVLAKSLHEARLVTIGEFLGPTADRAA